MSVFVNCSNHIIDTWSAEQREAAHALGCEHLVDRPFPNVDPEADEETIGELAWGLAQSLRYILDSDPPGVVMIQGESTLVFRTVSILKSLGIVCVAATTKREVEERDGKKISIFRFVQLRQY